jgi:hypothetical protein
MHTYYLQFSKSQNRLILHTTLYPQNQLKQTIQASSWVQAKYLLGYPLTNFQYTMLDL